QCGPKSSARFFAHTVRVDHIRLLTGGFMLRQMAMIVLGLCVMSSAAFADCSPRELSSFQSALDYLAGRAPLDTVQKPPAAISPGCQASFEEMIKALPEGIPALNLPPDWSTIDPRVVAPPSNPSASPAGK